MRGGIEFLRMRFGKVEGGKIKKEMEREEGLVGRIVEKKDGVDGGNRRGGGRLRKNEGKGIGRIIVIFIIRECMVDG